MGIVVCTADNTEMAAPRLHWINDTGEEEKVVLAATETLLGRKSDVDLRRPHVDLILPHKTISRHHAKIKKTVQGYLLLDLGSVRGTFVNGRRVDHHFLRDGDRIRLADYETELRFLEESDSTRVRLTDSSGSGSSFSAVAAVLKEETTPDEEIAQILSFEYRAEMVSNISARKELENELALAHETQESLLPHGLPTVEHLRIQAFSKPTRYVGGDFYDFLHTASGEFVSVLVDVSGKGVAASLLSSMMLGCIHALFRTGATLAEAVDQLNRFMCERSSGRFATMFICTLNEKGHGEFISAGHNPAYVFRPVTGGVDELASNNIIVGAFDTAQYEATTLKLDKGDVLVVYSDGLTEAEKPDGEMLGEEAVKQVILAEAGAGAGHLEQKLLEAIQAFTQGQSQSDDITIMIIERI